MSGNLAGAPVKFSAFMARALNHLSVFEDFAAKYCCSTTKAAYKSERLHSVFLFVQPPSRRANGFRAKGANVPEWPFFGRLTRAMLFCPLIP